MRNKPNFQKAEMKLNLYSAKDYENKLRFRTPKNKPNQTQPVVSLPALSLPVVSMPALSFVEVSNQSKGSNLF